MQNGNHGQTAKAEATGQAAAKRAEVARPRFHVAAQKDAALAAGGKRSAAEASPMVSESHAKGGRITICTPTCSAPPRTRDGRGGTS